MSEKKVAIVTGGSRGIGRGCALSLAKEGFNVAINYAGNEEAANKTVNELKELGVEAKAYKSDVGNSELVKKMIEEIITDFGRIDVLVNNAGITRDGLFMRMKDEDWLNVINTNLNSLYYVSKPVVKVMMKQRSGSIINISSISGVFGNAGQTNYSAAKAGVIGFTKSLAKEVAPRGITVNAIAPGFIETDMTKGLDKEKIAANIPMKKLGQVSDIAETVKFLATSAPYITAQTINVGGGLVI